jgi:colanic acid/amylovoran biosynthesis glycosyltransferase
MSMTQTAEITNVGASKPPTQLSLLIATSWKDSPVSQQFRCLGAELVSRGHRVVLLVDGQNRAVENPAGKPAVLTWPSPRPIRLQDARFLSAMIRKQRPDCLLANFGSVNLMTLVGWWHGVKHRIAWYHTVSSANDLDALEPPWKLALLRWRKRQVWRFATAIVSVAEAAREDLLTRFHVPAAKCHVIYNSLADPLLGQAVTKALSGENRILCVGRFHYTKGQDVLLRALASLKPALPQLRVEFLGDGPLRAECERLADDLDLAHCCRFVGAVPHEKVLQAMAGSDVTVVPSRSEAFGLVAMESLAMGTPVVASAAGGLPEILQGALGTWLVPPDDPEALAGKLKLLLMDAPGYSRLSSQSRARYLEEFEQGAAVKRQANWLESLLSPARRTWTGKWTRSENPMAQTASLGSLSTNRATIPRSFIIGTSWKDKPGSHYFRSLGAALVERGHRVVLLVDGQNRAAENPAGNPAVFTWPSLRPTRFQDARFLSAIIRKQRPDCLLSNFGSVNLMTLVGWWHGVKHRIAWHRTVSSAIDSDALRPPWKLALLRWRKRQVWRFATAVVAVAEAARQDLLTRFHLPAPKCHVIYNSLADPLPGQAGTKTLSGENRILCVGRFHHTKGQDVLLRALASLRPALPHMQVEFLGDGPLRAKCERLAHQLGLGGCCRFVGAVSHDRVLNATAQCDVTVVPSRNEAFGLVALESLAVGTPVVASAVGGLPEILQGALEAWLVPPDDPEALAAKLKLLLLDAAGYSRLSSQSRARFLEAFEQSAAVKRQADWLETLLSPGAPH